MPGTYAAATKTARMTAVRDAIDGGPGPGKLEIGTAGMAIILATITLDDPCGSVAGSVLTFAGFPKTVVAAATGTAAEARLRTSANVDVRTGMSVGVSMADINLDDITIESGQDVAITSATLTHG